MMNAGFWHKVPVVRLFIPFVLGVGIAMFATLPIPFIVGLLFLSAAGCVYFYFYNPSLRMGWMPACFAYVCMFTCGILLHHLQDIRIRSDYFENIANSKWAVVRISEQPVARKKSWKSGAEIIGIIDSSGKVHAVRGKLLVYIQKSDSLAPVSYADRLLIPMHVLKQVAPPQNPGEFNYKRYLAFHHCYHQVYLRHAQYAKLAIPAEPTIYTYIYNTQAYFKHVLATYVQSKNEMGIAQALLYGYDDDIDEETVQAFANTGTLHVLAVSGMHVGIIFMILNTLLKTLDRNRYTKWLKAVISLLILWIYSLLCGMSPSILRATVMFSFIVLSNTINRPANIYNTLAASAFLLMLFDCNIIANVGFQLSYMAVLGIVFLQPYIYQMLIFHSWAGNQIWKITSVSVAAQVATSPIGILYFHQFPNVFLFSNLFIIPLTTIILYGCLLLMAISPIHLLASILGYVIYLVIAFTNTLVLWVEKIPYAYIEGLQISIPQTLLLYAMAASIIAYFLRHEQLWFKSFLVFSFCFVCITSYTSIQQHKQFDLTVYNVSSHTAIRITRSRDSYILADSALYMDKEKKRFHLQQHIWNSGIESDVFEPIDERPRIIKAGNARLLVLTKQPLKSHKFADSVDMVICATSYPVQKLLHIPSRIFILTSAMGLKQAERLKQKLLMAGREVVSVRETGAFQLSLHEYEN
jgi:competence protein ComEC